MNGSGDRREPHAAVSSIAVAVLAVMVLLFLPLFGVSVVSLGDCVDPPCDAPVVTQGFYAALMLLAVATPIIAMRALFGDHPYSRMILTLTAVAFITGAQVGSAATSLAAGPALVVLVVALFAWWKWWTTMKQHPQPR